MLWNLLCMPSFLQLCRLSLGAPTTCLLLYVLFSCSSYTHYPQKEHFNYIPLPVSIYRPRSPIIFFSLYCLNPLALAPTCVVSAPRLPHLHWCNGILGTILPGHKLGIKGHRGKEWAAGEHHRGNGQLREDPVCHLEINRSLFHLNANGRRSIIEPRERAENKFSL